MSKLIEFFKNKGVLATATGLIFALPINIKLTTAFFKNVEMSDGQLKTAAIMNLIAMLWFMLPSLIEIKSNLFTITIKD